MTLIYLLTLSYYDFIQAKALSFKGHIFRKDDLSFYPLDLRIFRVSAKTYLE